MKIREGRKPMTRREFVGKTAAGAAAMSLGRWAFVPSRVWGANDRLGVGFVGMGARMGSLLEEVRRLSETHRLDLVAVCDIWNQRREAAAAKVQGWTGQQVAACRTLEEICARSDVDVLIIATADFQHAPHLAFAVRAGKDVYVEKPLGCDFDQIKDAWKAVQETGRVVQMGTQARGEGKYFGARDFIRSGKLGKVSYVEIAEPLFEQRWRIPGSENSLTEADTDWKEFQSYTYDPKLPFNARHYREFRLFWPYSSGCLCQWMSHKIDLVNLVLDELPRSAVCLGTLSVWNDGRNNPDTVQALLEYPSGVLVTYHMRLGNSQNGRGIFIYGTQGTMDLMGGRAYGDGGGGAVIKDRPEDVNSTFHVDSSTLLPKSQEGGVTWESPPDVHHIGHFFECVRSRERTRADIDAGFAHALATTMANLSYRYGCRMEYDAEKMELRKASGAA
jgi:predicted dehydrogenase